MKALTLGWDWGIAMTTPTASPLGRTRIEDVAAAANVSVATVSRALRNLPNVAESTRAHVAAVAEQLNYRADPSASRLAAGRGSTITVVVPHLASWYFSTVIAGAEAVCSEAGYECLITGVGSIAACNRLLDEPAHLERRTDGVVLVNLPASESQAESLRERGVALATVGTRTPDHPSVSIDDVHTGEIAVEHLVSLGHVRIGLISGQGNDPMNFAVPRQRRVGFVEALHTAGLDFDETLVESGNFGIDGGQEAMATLLDHPDPPTAVFAMSDEMAFGALMELDRRSMRAGTDISLVGVDDHDVARVVKLTTIRQRVGDQGAAAARALLARHRGSGRTGSRRQLAARVGGAIHHRRAARIGSNLTSRSRRPLSAPRGVFVGCADHHQRQDRCGEDARRRDDDDQHEDVQRRERHRRDSPIHHSFDRRAIEHEGATQAEAGRRAGDRVEQAHGKADEQQQAHRLQHTLGSNGVARQEPQRDEHERGDRQTDECETQIGGSLVTVTHEGGGICEHAERHQDRGDGDGDPVRTSDSFDAVPRRHRGWGCVHGRRGQPLTEPAVRPRTK